MGNCMITTGCPVCEPSNFPCLIARSTRYAPRVLPVNHLRISGNDIWNFQEVSNRLREESIGCADQNEYITSTSMLIEQVHCPLLDHRLNPVFNEVSTPLVEILQRKSHQRLQHKIQETGIVQ